MEVPDSRTPPAAPPEPGSAASPVAPGDTHGFPVEIPFLSDTNVRALSIADGRSVVQLRIEPRHCNSFRVAHGGAILTLMDAAMAMAGRSLAGVGESGEDIGMVTIEMKTSFMQAGTGLLTARGSCVHRTRSMAFCEAEIRDEAERLIGRASGTFKYVRQRR